MMVSDQHRQDPQAATTDSSASAAPAATQALDMASMIPFPRSEDEPAAASAMSSHQIAFAPLPFDESLLAAAGASSATATSIAGLSSATSSAMTGLPNFFLDTAALAQHLAAVVADEKKLSDVRSCCSC
jgi:hypothetical protein